MIATTTNQLSDQDAYVLARVLVGLPWTDFPASPAVELLLTNLDVNQPSDMQILRQVLGPENLHAILQVDPNGAPPAPRRRAGEVNTVPPLLGSVDIST